MEPILALQNNGFQIQLGHGARKQSNKIAYIKVVCICADNEAADRLSQCAAGGGWETGGDCRTCICKKIFRDKERFTKSKDDMWLMRDNSVLRELTEKLKTIDLARHQFSLTNPNNRFSITATEKNDIVRSKLLKLRGGSNIFMNLPSHVCPGGGLPAMLGPDIMHTCKGGMIKYLLEWVLEICYTLQDIYADKDRDEDASTETET